jgi:hypothetical protein
MNMNSLKINRVTPSIDCTIIDVTFKTLDWGLIAEALKGFEIITQLPPLKTFSIKVPLEDEDVIKKLQANPSVKRAEYSQTGTLEALTVPTSNEPFANDQWELGAIDLYRAHILQKGNSTVLAASCDSGCWVDNDDFINLGITGATINSSLLWDEPNAAHGTAVMSNISADSTNGVGMYGTAINIGLHAIRFTDESDQATDGNVASAFALAEAAQADIANLSWGGDDPNYQPITKFAMGHAWDNGIVVTKSAGNSAEDYISGPFYKGKGIAVAAMNEGFKLSYFTNYGPDVDVIAPGQNLIIATGGGASYQYGTGAGTSYASPRIAGVAALILSENPTLTPSQVRTIIMSTASKIFDYNAYIKTPNAGLVNAYKAVLKARSLKAVYVQRLLPYIVLHGTSGESVISTTQSAGVTTTVTDGIATIVPTGKIAIEAGAYCYGVNDSSINIQLFVGETGVHNGAPLAGWTYNDVVNKENLVNTDAGWAALGATTDVGDILIQNNELKFSFLDEDGANLLFNINLTAQNWLCVLFIAPHLYGQKTLKIFIDDEIVWYVGARPIWDDAPPTHIDVRKYTGSCTLKFELKDYAFVEGEITLREIYTTPDELTNATVTIDDYAGETISLVATYGGLEEVYTFDGTFEAPIPPASLNPIRTAAGENAGTLLNPSGNSGGTIIPWN